MLPKVTYRNPLRPRSIRCKSRTGVEMCLGDIPAHCHYARPSTQAPRRPRSPSVRSCRPTGRTPRRAGRPGCVIAGRVLPERGLVRPRAATRRSATGPGDCDHPRSDTVGLETAHEGRAFAVQPSSTQMQPCERVAPAIPRRSTRKTALSRHGCMPARISSRLPACTAPARGMGIACGADEHHSSSDSGVYRARRKSRNGNRFLEHPLVATARNESSTTRGARSTRLEFLDDRLGRARERFPVDCCNGSPGR